MAAGISVLLSEVQSAADPRRPHPYPRDEPLSANTGQAKIVEFIDKFQILAYLETGCLYVAYTAGDR
jgi:hypothetical protein